MSPKTGRPKIEEPRSVYIGIRLKEDEARELDQCCSILNMSRSDAIREAIKKLSDDLKVKE